MANTIAGVNLAAIAEESLPSLQSCFAPLRGVMGDFSPDIAARGESVTTRVPTKPTAADLSSGYSATDVAMAAKTVTLNTFYGFVWGFTDTERSKSSLMLNDLFIQPALQALGDKVFGDIWNLVLAANFATDSTITAANFDRDDLVDLGATLTDTKKAPKTGRSLWADPQHYGSLVKSLNSAEIPGITADKAEAQVPRVAKFDCYETDLADDNSESLAAFAFHRSSLLMAARGVDATGAAAAGVEISDITIPGLDIPVQFRRWYDPETGTLKYSVGLLYGVALGNDMGVRVKIA
jgi:hypothetical protein